MSNDTKTETLDPAVGAQVVRGVMQHSRGLWQTYTLVDHDGPPACDEVQVQAVRNGVWQRIAECSWSDLGKHEPTRSEAQANARLMAAAPLLALALSAMLTHMGMDEDEWNAVTFEQARQALRAAGCAA